MRADAAGARRKSGGGARARQQPAAATACDGPRGGDGRAVSVQPRRMRAARPLPHPHSARQSDPRTRSSRRCVAWGGAVEGSSPEIADGAPLIFNVRISFLRESDFSNIQNLAVLTSTRKRPSGSHGGKAKGRGRGSTAGRRCTSFPQVCRTPSDAGYTSRGRVRELAVVSRAEARCDDAARREEKDLPQLNSSFRTKPQPKPRLSDSYPALVH